MSWFRPRRATPTDRPVSCREAMRVLQDHLDGELDPAASARVLQHLERCRNCGMEADLYRQIKASLANEASDLPPEARERLAVFAQDMTTDAAGGKRSG